MSCLIVEATDGYARTGCVTTRRGTFRIPAFMPVGTHGGVRALHPDEVRECGAEIVLSNAYHLALRPGLDVVERAGGIHGFMGWDGPILTDSGGYQLVSLAGAARIDNGGAVFVSPYDGTRLRVTPEEAVSIQSRLGADVIMCLDQPVAFGAGAGAAAAATARTHRWAQRCVAAHPGDGALLFGIAQGGFDEGTRRESAAFIAALGFDGNAVGGLSVGEPIAVMEAMARASTEELPEDRPRYFMGLGTDEELLTMVGMGIDMFDCVVPTRLARNGTALTADGRLSLRNSVFRDDLRPIDDACACQACARFSRAYLRHLFTAGEILAHRLVSIHNITHLSRLMRAAAAAIREQRFEAFRREVSDRLRGREPAGPRLN
ncbi:MAG: tRNA guanosine(34) transglycosylase Tgt [Candidatus Dormibacteraeota bacterium]|nr:tRNA guanosine(34) transglycosylase Tgt [Candidatus Dormibacteraeota bacterium]MBV9525251.1 tRNA guanosine(34) transglycosylase Tgt [Candidatus Dormibacteraeota bacterium]